MLDRLYFLVEAQKTELADNDRNSPRDKGVISSVKGLDYVLSRGFVECGNPSKIYTEWVIAVIMNCSDQIRIIQPFNCLLKLPHASF